VKRVSCENTLKKEEKPMLSVIKILGLGMWIGILSMAIAPLLFKNATEQDVTSVYVAIMDSIVIMLIIRFLWNTFGKSKRQEPD
jgi:hypothetical protein